MRAFNLGAVRRALYASAVLTLLSVPSLAQVVERGRTFADLTASHPCDTGLTNRIARVTDCDAADDIGDGEGAFQCWAICDGSAPWVAQAIGGGAGGAGDVLLAGDADGQTIQGRTGSNAARVDIGEAVETIAQLRGQGASPGYVQANAVGAYLSSADEATYLDLYDGNIDLETNGIFFLTAPVVRIVSAQAPPTNANDPCAAGDTIDTATFHYYCHATDSWVRAPMAAW